MSTTLHPDETIFYLLDKTIRLYRQMAQRKLIQEGFDITIDQWLILSSIKNNPDATQNEIAETVFKDTASLTRIIELLVKKKLVTRKNMNEDRRRFQLTITAEGDSLLEDVVKVVKTNRKTATKGITAPELEILRELLGRMAVNCISTKEKL